MTKTRRRLAFPAIERETVLARFPWVTERGRLMVLGNDLDALLSGLLLHHLRGWEIAGFYDLKDIYYRDDLTPRDLLAAIWVDLDIAHPECRSIGHHILTYEPDAPLPRQHEHSLNPNLLRGVTAKHFAKKYPLSTIHYLMFLFEFQPDRNLTHRDAIYWLADSTWIIAQKYEKNVTDWLENCVTNPYLLETVGQWDTRGAEQKVAALIGAVPREVQIAPGRGQIRSKHLGLHGYQFKFRQPEQAAIQAAMDFLAQAAGLARITVPAAQKTIAGQVNRFRGDLAGFIDREEIFSYAIPSSDVIRSTSIPNSAFTS